MSAPLKAMIDASPLGAALPAPFEPVLAEQVRTLIARLDAAQRAWLSGYLAGTLGTLDKPGVATAESARPLATIIYGSHSGNSEQLARRLAETLTTRGLGCITLDMMDCRKQHLLDAQHLCVIVSTHGEGDLPDRARPLYELLLGRKAPTLAHLKYSVLALGDSSYEKFCEAGRRFDTQLETLGAQRLQERAECDVDFAAVAETWIGQVVERIAAVSGASSVAVSAAVSRSSASVATAYTRRNPWRASLLANQRLTARDSSKDVRHIELSIEGAGIHYEPGDSLGVVPRNHASDVIAVLKRLPFDAESAVSVSGSTMPLREALTDHLDIGLLNRSLVERYAAATEERGLGELCLPDNAVRLDERLHGRHLIDLIVDHPPADLDAASFVRLLRPLAPRLYSIASSPRVTPDEVHLTVSIVGYESLGRPRHGVVSGALADLTDDDSVALVYPHRNPAFRLPSNPDAPIIMIGPGTGVAPFRAFVAEREALGARGRNWLFFGDRSFRSDFLYQVEWLDWRKRGLLHRIDVAFSRDTDRKVYVQQRMREEGREIYAWLRNGAHIYVCGDAQRMAPDVDRTLRGIIQEHGAVGAERADEFVLDLQRERRYQKDVY